MTILSHAVETRQERAIRQRADYVIFPTVGTENDWTVQKIHGKGAGKSYQVNPKLGTCTCADATGRLEQQHRCKHGWMVLAHVAEGAPDWQEFHYEPQADEVLDLDREARIATARQMIDRDFPND